ncbi:alpha/beta fold hydrolase [Kribbella sp. NBC_00382]|uniref:alpha/beta fold hydrolase n=1 Tax=Kribbella sp. NBC_00382 TaxID=2975967 RepID=UPI002E1B89D0
MRATTCPPGIVDATVDQAFGQFETLVRGASDYFTDVVSGRTTPLRLGLDLVSWAKTVARREPPRWATENTVLAEWPIARLRDFTRSSANTAVPMLLLPPQAGHDSCIVDYDPLQSQIRTALDSGLTRVLSLDWIGATAETKNASIEDYIAVVDEAVALVGGRVHLVGDCQGGWLAVIYAALHPETIETLTIAGAPVDFHAGEPLIHNWMQVLSPLGDLAFYRAVVEANGGVLPGRFLLAGFVAMQPANELDRQLQLLLHIGEPRHVSRYRTFENWFQHTQPIPGAFYLWIVEKLFQNNELVAGTLQVAGNTVDLARITCPVYLLAGATDHITPPPQVFALADYVGTGPADIHRRQTTGGHLGLFMGHQALREHWRPLFAELAARS